MSREKVECKTAATNRCEKTAWRNLLFRDLLFKEGLPRIPAPHKREAIRMLLEDETWGKRSARAIAEQVGCDHKTVTKVRRRMAGESREVIEGGAFRTRFLKACEMIADIEDPNVLWREMKNAELAVVREARKKLHRILYGARTLPDNLYPKGLPNPSTSDQIQ